MPDLACYGLNPEYLYPVEDEESGEERESSKAVRRKGEQDLKLSPPDKFLGEPKFFRAFKAQCQLHFMAKPLQFVTDQARVVFVISNLGGDALAWATPLIERQSSLLKNYAEFEKAFAEVFERKYARQARGSEFLNLRQGNGTLVHYVARFRQLSLELGWEEDTQYAIFMEGLRDEIKDVFQGIFPLPETVKELISLAVQVDQRMRERRGELSRGGARKIALPIAPRAHGPSVPGSRLSSGSGRVTEWQNSALGSRGLDNRKLSSRNSGPISNEERERRRKRGLCMYCGQEGHLLKDCPFTRKIQSSNSLAGSAVSAVTVDAGMETVGEEGEGAAAAVVSEN